MMIGVLSLLMERGVLGIRFVIDREECFSHNVEYEGDTVHLSFVVIKADAPWHYADDGVDLVEASAIPFAALTAWRALKSTARITKGQRVLVMGGGGAVGGSAVQIAAAAGCYVSTTCGSESIDRILTAGADQAVDYTAENLEVAIEGQFDAVLDTIGVPETERLGINLLKRGGHYMTLQGEAAALTDRYGLAIGLPTATAILLKKQLQYRYSHGIGHGDASGRSKQSRSEKKSRKAMLKLGMKSRDCG